MIARSIIILSLAGCNYDYSILAGVEGAPLDTGTGQEPATSYEYVEDEADDTDAEGASDEAVEEPAVEGDSDDGALEDTGAPDGDAPVDVRVDEEEPPPEEPAEEDPPADPPPPPPPPCDADADGWDGPGCGGSDCDDSDPIVHPLGGDSWGDGLDDDCDGLDCNAAFAGGTYIAACITDAPTSHSSADALCTAGGHDGLASLQSPGEWSLGLSLRPLSVGHSTGKYRIGLTSPGPGEPFQWASGGSPAADQWAPEQPSWGHLGSEELCGIIYPSDMPGYLGPNKLNDEWCWEHGDELKGFICETRE